MSLTWLHISDFHIRGGDPYDRDTVLGALVKSVAEYRRSGGCPDLIFASGDVAHSGKREEYLLADKFFDDLLAAAGLEKSRRAGVRRTGASSRAGVLKPTNPHFSPASTAAGDKAMSTSLRSAIVRNSLSRLAPRAGCRGPRMHGLSRSWQRKLVRKAG